MKKHSKDGLTWDIMKYKYILLAEKYIRLLEKLLKKKSRKK
jgi:hypothetical protein